MSLDSFGGPYIPEEPSTLDNTLSEIISGSEILKESQESKQDLLENILEEGMVIDTYKQLSKIQLLFSKNGIHFFDKISQDDFNNIGRFGIQKQGEVVKVFPLFHILSSMSNGPFGEAFELSNDGTILKTLDAKNTVFVNGLQSFQSSMEEVSEFQAKDHNYVLDNQKNQSNNGEKPNTFVKEKNNTNQRSTGNPKIIDTQEKEDENVSNHIAESKENPDFIEYEIKKSDTLWNVIRDKYGLSDYTDIANTLYQLKKYNQKNNDDTNSVDFNNPDKINIGEKILLPNQIIVTSRSKGTSTFILQ